MSDEVKISRILYLYHNIKIIISLKKTDSSETAGMKPLAYLNLNTQNLDPSGSLRFNQVKKLFSEVKISRSSCLKLEKHTFFS